ncbi:energy-coupling factor transporter ATPase [Bifidobacterium sp. ESL0745]|uniref:energy-coupling factor transporter ATPase n=1 Tax=Bifidobacterium sp. ESL0745 TaxID=2983226 RepID=UPI0023F9EDEC|nr:energy-coupling factor transporter ATPase [Bifidobacterium sp. ESL0745]MDF7664935.1 energy-coupling factor transporter ATPase [Bifidobacterium sp. ESL0745]
MTTVPRKSTETEPATPYGSESSALAYRTDRNTSSSSETNRAANSDANQANVANGFAARLKNTCFSYDSGKSWVLDGINLDIHAGERLCLVGPNGSGKSTLARLVAGLAAPDSGSVTLLGCDVFCEGIPHSDLYRKARKGIGAVFQNPVDQIITTVVGDDVAFGPENLALDPKEITTRVNESLDAVEMSGFLNADPSRMSGGQQQRTAIAGILAMRPKMIVLDEPTAMLDLAAQHDVLRVLDNLQKAGTTIVHVTHRPEELKAADRIVSLENGRLIELNLTEATLRLSVTNADDIGMFKSDGLVIDGGLGKPGNIHAAKPADRQNRFGTDDTKVSEPTVSGNSSLHSFKDHKEPDTAPTPDPRYSSGEPAISFEHVSFRYPKSDTDTLHDFSMRIEQGEVVAIMGRNGTGKTTLTKLMTALSKPDDGTINVAGIDLGSMKRRDKKALRSSVGLVMQQPEHQLFAETVRQDVAYGPSNQDLPQQVVDQRVDRALNLLGISALAERSPFSLSGGQQRLAAIAGIIACDPRILILDEPTAGLDATASERIYALVRTLNTHGVTIVMITHSPRQARQLADRVITLGEPVTADANTADEQAAASANRDFTATKSVDTTPQFQSSPASCGALSSTTEACWTRADGNSTNPTGKTTQPVIEHRHSETRQTAKSNLDRTAQPTKSKPGKTTQSIKSSFGEATDKVAKRNTSGGRSKVHNGKSIIERLDSRVKLVVFLVLMFTSFIVSSLPQLGLTAVMVIILAAAAKLGPKQLFRSMRGFLVLLLVMGVINMLFVRTGKPLVTFWNFPITDEGVMAAVLYTCRFGLVILLGIILLQTTTPTALTDGFGSLLSPLRKLGLHTQELALVMSLALRFLPTLADEARNIMDAQAARGGSIETGSPTKRIKALVAIIVPIFAGALRHSDNLSLALDARCYEEGIRRTHWNAMRIRGRDMMFILLCALYLVVLLSLKAGLLSVVRL